MGAADQIVKVPAVEAARRLRAALRVAFPGQKFSVRTRRSTYGHGLSVRWAGGPTQTAVGAVASAFEGRRSDAMTDCSRPVTVTYAGARVRYLVTDIDVYRVDDEQGE
ncbi:LPD29 domain-containing protein [Cellulosimicrobium cellulans]|uniref:LPD29 domain-containing protein n=1 Tax=Cellulosimicrobium cellulans TaxID=1710 RepID=UPI00381BA76B